LHINLNGQTTGIFTESNWEQRQVDMGDALGQTGTVINGGDPE